MIDELGCVYILISQGKCPINDYTPAWQLQCAALPVPDSELNARNAPGADLYCNRQPHFADWTNRENFNTMKIFTQNIFNVKISRPMYGRLEHYNDVTLYLPVLILLPDI